MTDSVLNKLTGKLLRSGRAGDYSSLGEMAQPVFRVAEQLREALRRKLGFINGDSGPTYADHFAVPKTDQMGDVIDWYSNYPGDVIPWSTATEDERDSARQQLRVLESKIVQYCNDFNAQASERASSRKPTASAVDPQVFTQLLAKVLYTPGANYIYLVNGFPVLTFWGFVYPKMKVPLDPLLHLFDVPKVAAPVAAPVVAPIAAAVQAVPAASAVEPVVQAVAPVETVKKPWWRWLWWLLPLLLLLFLLFGLRQCSPEMANKIGMPDFGFNAPEFNKPSIKMPTLPDMPRLPNGTLGAPSDTGLGGLRNNAIDTDGGLGSNAANMPELAPSVDEGQLPDLSDPAAPHMPVEPSEQPEPPQPPAIPEPSNPDFEPPLLDDEPNPAAPVVPGKSLQIPPAASNGQANFLNGKWKAGAGIQDKNTGKPLRLEYEFNKGKGQVTVEAADGMRCTGDVDAQMADGSMRIQSLGRAVCPDGTSFDMPEITCAPGATSAADCVGNYADTRFPMSMRNTQ